MSRLRTRTTVLDVREPQAKWRSATEIEWVLHKCDYPGYEFEVHAEHDDLYLQIVCPDGTDTKTGEPLAWKGRKWKLSGFMTDTEIVQTAWAAVQRCLIHEASELFTYKDAPIFDRHISVDRLVELCESDHD